MYVLSSSYIKDVYQGILWTTGKDRLSLVFQGLQVHTEILTL